MLQGNKAAGDNVNTFDFFHPQLEASPWQLTVACVWHKHLSEKRTGKLANTVATSTTAW